MAQSHRVIVTGTNNAGKSVVVEDAQASLAGTGQFRFLADRSRASRHTKSRSAGRR